MALDERRAGTSRRWIRPRRETTARVTLAVIVVVLAVAALAAMRLARSSELIHVSRVAAGSESTRISVTALHNQCQHDPQARIVEQTDQRVRIRIDRRRGLMGDCEDIGLTSTLEADLETVLGTRVIVVETASTGFECVIDGVASDRCTAG